MNSGEVIGDVELAKMEKKNDKWTPNKDDEVLIKKLMLENPKLDYEMASSAYMWCKSYPEQVEAWEKGELLMEDSANKVAIKALKLSDFIYKTPPDKIKQGDNVPLTPFRDSKGHSPFKNKMN